MNYKTQVFSLVLMGVLLPVLSAHGADPVEFKTLVGIPGLDNPELSFGDYINALYALSISIAALLSVIKIIIAGMKYMLSDVVTTKGEAIKDIQGALFGLLVVISAVLILRVINPQLTETSIFLDKVTESSNQGALATTANYSGPDIPLNKKTNCLPNATGSNENCAPIVAECQATNGRPTVVRNTLSADEVICKYGTEFGLPCKVSSDENGLNVYECSEQIASCQKVGTPHEMDSKVICVKPFR